MPDQRSNYPYSMTEPKYLILDVETTGLFPYQDRLVTIGVKDSDFEEIFHDKDEKKMMEKFWTFIQTSDYTHFVGFNIRFDLWFLNVRSIKHELPITKLGFIDLRQIIAIGQWNARGTLADCIGLWKSVDKGISGSEIPALFINGDMDSIVKHNRDDIQRTEELFLRMQRCGLV